MAPTSDERREVAARLRSCVPEINGMNDFAMFLNHWIGVGNANVDGLFSVKSDRRTAEMTLEKLADLIDPTCHNASPQAWGTFECSKCGAQTWYQSIETRPRFCPDCGARVVDEVGDD